jgi:hypothetical protein
MKFNPSQNVRLFLYIFTAVGTPVVAYLKAKGYIGDLEMILWSAEVTVISGLAALNVKSQGTEPPSSV